MADEGALGLAVPDVPQPQGVVARAGGKVVRIRMPLDHIHVRVVPCIKSKRHDPLMISPFFSRWQSPGYLFTSQYRGQKS